MNHWQFLEVFPMKFVVFDLGGVMVKIRRTWQEVCDGVGLIWPPDAPDIQREIFNLYHRYHADEFSVSELASKLSLLTEQRFSPEQCLMAHRGILVGEYTGINQLIDELHHRGTQTAVLSNTCADHWAILKTYPSVASIHRHFTSFELKVSKPDPKIYQKVKSELGVAPHELLFFDDSAENIQAAKTCGWNGEVITSEGEPHQQLRKYLETYEIL